MEKLCNADPCSPVFLAEKHTKSRVDSAVKIFFIDFLKSGHALSIGPTCLSESKNQFSEPHLEKCENWKLNSDLENASKPQKI